MIIKSIKILSQNIYKNKLLLNTLLENCKNYDIIFIQEPSWSFVWYIPCTFSKEDKEMIGTPNLSSWTLFTWNYNNEYLKILTYINIQLLRLYFSLRKNIINYKDINLIFFFNNSSMFFLNQQFITWGT